MKKYFYFPFLLLGMILLSALFSCGEIAPIHEVRLIDSLNQKAYNYRYKNLDTVYAAALQAYGTANLYRQGKAEASNHLGFHAFMQMDFEAAEQYHKDVFNLTSNELECLAADIGLMKVYQRTSMNKEFYDYRNQALSRISRINEDISLFVDAHEKQRINYALSEFHIVSAIYYYYLQQHTEAQFEMDHVKMDDALKSDVAQWLYYYYVKGSAGLCETEDVESYIVCKFDNLYYCWRQSVLGNYIYFEANALQGIAELLTSSLSSDILYTRRSQALRTINTEQYPDTLLPLKLAEKALKKFKQYDDIYQIAGTYRTIGNWFNERGDYYQALDSLQKALDQVNRHHELYYHCLDTLDRLKTYCPKDTVFIERGWINSDHIKTVPEWIARIREQLSVTYAGLGMKPASDYNRNIYLDILNDTRQDKELESRYTALEEEARELNFLIVLVIIGMLLLVPFFWIFNRRWEKRNRENVERLRKTLDVCQKITNSIPFDAKDAEEIISSLTNSIISELKSLLPVLSLQIGLWDEETQEIVFSLANGEEDEYLVTDDSHKGISNKFILAVPDKDKEIGELYIYTSTVLKKDDITIIKVILPYIAWVLENGLAFISLGDEQRHLEKELYVHEQHIVENKRQNLIKRTCMSIVVGLNPFIDRIINEISKLREKKYTRDEKVRNEKYQYIDELITKINEYNDILALWIKMKQGALSLNIENFQLNDLFEVIAKGRKTFEMKQQEFTVVPVDVIVKADKALTLFMINTLTENARKYTPKGGEISVYAKETDEFVEISVEDNGRGMSPEDISLILDEKIYDSKQIGIHSKEDLEELGKIKGSGFGLMNCKGIIEKYRKTNEIFRVCKFGVESEIGKGSRFFFRLPKGVRKTLTVLLFVLLNGITFSCMEKVETLENVTLPPPEFKEELEDSEFDRLLDEASYFADTAYYCNVVGEHEYAIQYIDSSMTRLNEHYEKYAYQPDKKMVLMGLGTAAEIEWWNERFDSDYHVILDIRNEAAVAFLALKNWQAYHYNNRAYTGLYKLLGEDTYLEDYCRRLEESTSNKIVGIILCLVLILIFFIAYYTYYVRRRFLIRRNLEEVLDINQHVFSASLMRVGDDQGEMIIPKKIVKEIFDAVNELLIIESLGIAVYNEESRKLEYVFNPDDFEEKEVLQKEMAECFEEEKYIVSEDRRRQCFPLIVEIGQTHRCIGSFALVKQLNADQESDRILSELVTRFIAIVVYNAVVKLANKCRDIESVQDETNRASHEEGLIHVQNMVLDNCLSTIKHETVYYPNKIKQILDKLMKASLSSEMENESLATIGELISYYKDIYTILSSCASRQLEEVTFRRSIIPIEELTEYTFKYYTKISKKAPVCPELQIEGIKANIIGDRVLLKLLLENLLNEAFSYSCKGTLKLEISEEGEFIRFGFTDKRRNKSVEELNHLFYPHLSSMCVTEDGRLLGIEYLICKQIIRDHDEYAGRRGCRMNAEVNPEGGFTVYFTVPKR